VEQWTCPVCGQVSGPNDPACPACGASRLRGLHDEGRVGSASGPGWRCAACETMNAAGNTTCTACGSSMPTAPVTTSVAAPAGISPLARSGPAVPVVPTSTFDPRIAESASHGTRSGSRTPWLVSGVVIVALLGLIVFLLARPHGTTPTVATTTSVPPPAASDTTTTTEAPSGGGDGPSGGIEPVDSASPTGSWTQYSDPTTGFSIWYPYGWNVDPTTGGDFFRDPGADAYMLVAYTSPAGPSAIQAWQQQIPGFASAHSDYQTVSLTGGTEQATWEYTYSDSGTEMHGIDWGEIVDNGQYGVALNWVTDEGDWSGLQPTFQAMEQSFIPPGG